MKKQQKQTKPFRFYRYLLRLVYIKMTVEGIENLPDEPAIIVGNHSQMHAPIACELYLDDNFCTWCAGQMMKLKEVPAYAYSDFWSQKPKSVRWLFKIASYIIAPLAAYLLTHARTIPVYRDNRYLSTCRKTIEKLKEGTSVIIFPEHDKKHNNIVYDFQDGFIDIARLYYKKTGKELSFVPLYIAPNLKKMYFGKPVCFSSNAPIEAERRRICDYLMNEISDMAYSLPLHTVVPYRNIRKKDYPTNVPKEEIQ